MTAPLIINNNMVDDTDICLSENAVIRQIDKQNIEKIITDMNIDRNTFFKSGYKKFTREDVEDFNLIIQRAHSEYHINYIDSFLILAAGYVDINKAIKLLSTPIFRKIKEDLAEKYHMKKSAVNSLSSFFN